MNKRSAFTLIELLAVVVILGILMGIAIPGTLYLIDRNKKTTYIENARTFVSLVKNKVQIDKNLELPMKSDTALVVTLEYLNTNDIVESPYGDLYDTEASFVAITLELNKYVYYVHLVSCYDEDDCDKTNYSSWSGIELIKIDRLNDDDRYDQVRDQGVNANLINELSSSVYLSGKTIYLNDGRL